MNELAAGTVIAGRYAILRPLGRGATKQVYLAEDRLFGTQVALALLIQESGGDPTLAARFSREGRAASVLRSPFVVRVYDVGKLGDGTRYLATEAVIGRGLDAAMANGAVAPEDAARWTMQVLAALSEAHARGVLHRDVKPENVLLAPTSQGEVAKLTDFGLAKVLDVALEGSLHLRTAQNIVLGTPEYMSPEQWQGLGLDARTDVYATGVMLYEMLAGHAPFEGTSLHVLCGAHMTLEPPPFARSVGGLMRALEPIVRRALAKRPEDRFATAAAMREAIESASGLRLDYASAPPSAAVSSRLGRAELVSDAWRGPVSLIARPNVIIGRESDADIVVRCLPVSDDNAMRSRTISRQHARIEWRGGKAFITDMDSRTGTRVGDRKVGSEPVELRDRDEVFLGKHVHLLFEHSPAPPGELPRWARLCRLDEYGVGQIYVMVLTEAKVSGAPDAAIPVPATAAAGDVLRIRAQETGLAILPLGSIHAVPLQDGQTLRVGSVSISVAIDR